MGGEEDAMTKTLSVAALQTTYGENKDANIAKTERLVRDAAKRGAQVILPSELFQGPYFCTTQEERWFATAIEGAPRVRFVQAVYALEFGEGRTISDPLVMAEALRRAGLDAALVESAQQDAVKLALRASTDEAMAAGVFGAPSFVIDGELFWGQDRLDFVRRKLLD